MKSCFPDVLYGMTYWSQSFKIFKILRLLSVIFISDFNRKQKLGPAKDLAAYSYTVFSLLKGLTCFGLTMSTAAAIGHPV